MSKAARSWLASLIFLSGQKKDLPESGWEGEQDKIIEEIKILDEIEDALY